MRQREVDAEISAAGFEPAASWSQTTRSAKLSYALLCAGLNDRRVQRPEFD